MSLLYRNSFPQYLQAVAIGPDPSFMEKNTTNCELVSAFPKEVELMYDWKYVKNSSDPINALRSFSKKLIIYGPDLDVQTIKFFVRKVKNYPEYYTDTIFKEVNSAFQKAKEIKFIINKNQKTIYVDYEIVKKDVIKNKKTNKFEYTNKNEAKINISKKYNIDVKKIMTIEEMSKIQNTDTQTYNVILLPNERNTVYNRTDIFDILQIVEPKDPKIKADFISYGRTMDSDELFLNRLAAALNSCESPCNYFMGISDVVGTLVDLGKSMTGSTSIPFDSKNNTPPPIGIGMNIYNKINPAIRFEFTKLKIITDDLYKRGISPFFKSNQIGGEPPDMSGKRPPLTNDTQTQYSKSEIYSDVQLSIKQHLGDCYKMYDDSLRYNPYDSTMNLSYSKVKFTGLKNSGVSSYINILGYNAPGQYVTENTYRTGLDVPSTPESRMYDDAPVRKKYDTYQGPSGGYAAAIDAQQAQGGAGLQNIPSNGKSFTLGVGGVEKIRFTKYGYVGELKGGNPDSGSFIGLGSSGNMIVPLRTIALNPNAKTQYGIKQGDILIITIKTKDGETFTERRQVGDISENKAYFNVDEFLPQGMTSKLVSLKDDSFTATIQVADTKEPLPKYNPVEASNFAAMYLSKAAWDYVINKNNQRDFGQYLKKMPTEYIKFVKWTA